MEETTDWRRGKPPSVGWWNVSLHRNPKIRRHWSGTFYSQPVVVGVSTDEFCERIKNIPDYSVKISQLEYRGLRAPRSE